ncbi:DUF685 domain-containing protein [Borreliella bavariensis]|uniref:DUF685 domain-containing protein n=1 Tax=Borreliella bavariensis TaxID=664662 RepID=UPI001C000366|nr:DUF685 domain-containing protein [Borreliella bavariensis]
MAIDQEKLSINEEETVQIKDLNRVNDVKNTDLLLLDDGVASSNAITYENFLKTTKDKTFKGEGLGYFKEIIKSTIAEELAADTDFVEKVYTKIINKLIKNDSTNLSNLFDKIYSILRGRMTTTNLSRFDFFLTTPDSSTILRTPIPENLTGLPSNFSFGGNFSGTTLYPNEYKSKKIRINMTDYDEIVVVFNKTDDNKPIYLDIELHIKHPDDSTHKILYLRYSDESETNMVYGHANAIKDLSILFPIYKGWYLQRRAYYSSGNAIPVLLKL